VTPTRGHPPDEGFSRSGVPQSSRLTDVKLEITPEPAPEEREAIERALARLLAESAPEGSAWWREGVRENLDAGELEVRPGKPV
jgi:hypothetical protein